MEHSHSRDPAGGNGLPLEKLVGVGSSDTEHAYYSPPSHDPSCLAFSTDGMRECGFSCEVDLILNLIPSSAVWFGVRCVICWVTIFLGSKMEKL